MGIEIECGKMAFGEDWDPVATLKKYLDKKEKQSS